MALFQKPGATTVRANPKEEAIIKIFSCILFDFVFLSIRERKVLKKKNVEIIDHKASAEFEFPTANPTKKIPNPVTLFEPEYCQAKIVNATGHKCVTLVWCQEYAAICRGVKIPSNARSEIAI